MINNKELEIEIFINEELKNKEDVLRFMCKTESNGLTWNDICEIVNPRNPERAKINLLKHLSKNKVSNTYALVEEKLNSIEDRYFDVTFYRGVTNMLDKYFQDKQEEFLDIMIHICNGIKPLKYPIEEIFRQTWIYFQSKGEGFVLGGVDNE